MGEQHLHTCVFFDDGDPELLCVCGGRAMFVVEEEGAEGMVVVLVDDDVTPADVYTLRQELAVSA